MFSRKRFLIPVLSGMFFILSACAATPSVNAPSIITSQIQSGVAHTCLLTVEGKVFCWGQNYSQDQNVSLEDYAKPIMVEGIDAIAIGVGWYHTCSASMNGRVQCWGQNTFGQLGNNSVEDAVSPVEVNDLRDVISLAAGSAHTCALTNAGKVYCWGQNDGGQLGDGTTIERHVPVAVDGLSGRATNIVAGSRFTCALLTNGRVQCWGELTFLPAESDNARNQPAPIQIPNLERDVVEMAAGNYHLCILTKAGEVMCEGMIVPPGDPPFAHPSKSLKPLTGRTLHLLAGTDFTCVLTAEKNIECWGDNYFGQLGNPTGIGSETPIKIDLKNQSAAAVGGGYYTGCALLSNGGVTCWGDTSFGQLGDGTVHWK